MITREQVADLRPGDVVEMSWPDGTVLRGPVTRRFEGWLYLGPYLLRATTGLRAGGGNFPDDVALAIISRAPRPLYVNHDRTTPVPGDVVRDADSDDDIETWNASGVVTSRPSWFDRYGYGRSRKELPERLRLLVDGETGQVVP